MKKQRPFIPLIGFFIYLPLISPAQETDTTKTQELKEVIIRHRKKTTDIDLLQPLKVEKISARELMKAACCNLSESFETTPSVDVAFTDAISGYKQIQLLGLAGPYTSITRENIPDARGLSAVTGLTFTPGSWIEGMQLSKGTGSVVNGYESVAGQINVEWKKPFEAKEPRWYLNLYQSTQGRTEGNAVYKKQFNESLSTNLLLHGRSNWLKNDQNGDGFLDQPLDKQLVLANRWFWFGSGGWEIQGGVKTVWTEQTGGQWKYARGVMQETGNPWGYQQDIQRTEGWAKLGRVFKGREATSAGLQLSGVIHDQQSMYGNTRYTAHQKSFYANLIYQTYLGTKDHVIKAGASTLYDRYQETFTGMPYGREEIVPGIFTEYAWNKGSKFNLVAGLRADHHNLYGSFFTPRLHIRYAPSSYTAFRLSAGRAQRTANIFTEYAGYMASSRAWAILPQITGGAYGFKPEVAWNAGFNVTRKFRLNYREGSVSADYYYTHFQQQVIADIENPYTVRLYNLDGSSYAHSFQAQLDYELIRRLDIRIAYRWQDVRTTYDGVLKEKPLIAAHRAFINAGYETRSKWKFDYTLQWMSSRRVPLLHPDAAHTTYSGSRSPSYIQMNAQISKSWNDFEIYLGGENLTGYMQNPIVLGASDPYAAGFDASMIWGPAMGRNIYMGFRYRIP